MIGATSAPVWVARWFRGAAIYGVLVLVPAYFLPVPVGGEASHFGFVGTALVFQALFWMIGGDPVRYRPVMLCAVAEKLVFAVPVAVLFARGKVDAVTLCFALIDLVLCAGFLLAWRATPKHD